jgi:serine protease inhibitor
MDPQTVFALASTVNFAAGWDAKFSESNTKNAVFHAPNGDITTPFMNKTIWSHTYYRGKNFGAIALELTGSNRMWLILPDEGYTTADILAGEEYLRMTLDPGSWESKGAYELHLSLPKFDVVNQTDLSEGIKAMGVTDIFDHTASNFTPITDTPMLAVNGINHAARVSIDEDGCVAAAFTVINPPTGGDPAADEKLDFVLDRPFLFVVSGRDNLPLFAGVVNKP